MVNKINRTFFLYIATNASQVVREGENFIGFLYQELTTEEAVDAFFRQNNILLLRLDEFVNKKFKSNFDI